MNILQSIIGALNKEESRNYKLFINRTNPGEDRKDVLLFDLIKKQYPDYKEDSIALKLYGKEDKNALYRLKNRVLEDLSKSISLFYFNEDDVNAVLYQTALSMHFRRKGMAQVAFYYLGKAEKRALGLENLQLLDLIYSEFIRLSHETLLVNPEEYILKRKENREKLDQLRQIDDVLAAVIYRIQISQNLGGSDTQILDVLQKTVLDFADDKSVRKNPALRFKIYESVSKILLQRNDFDSLERYLHRTFDEFTAEALFSRNNHNIKLQMLTYFANSQFKLGKYEESLASAAKLLAAMKEYDGFLQDKYLAYYFNTLVINYSQMDIRKAIDTLNEAKDNPVIKKLPVYNVFIFLNLAVTHFDIREFKASLKHLLKLTMSDSFAALDESFRFKVAIVELMIRYELEDHEFVLHKLAQVRKEFPKQCKNPDFKREREILDLFPSLIESTGVRHDVPLKRKIDKFLKTRTDSSSDIINYNNWLKSKLRPE